MKNICDQGYINLVNAIVRRASEDYLLSSPGTGVRKEVEKFFRSGWFEELTGADGDAMCKELDKKYMERREGKKLTKQVRVRGRFKRRVQCVETGTVYESLKQAAEACGTYGGEITVACQRGRRAGGYHWRYVKENKDAAK